MLIRKVLVVLAVAGFVAGCSSTPEIVIDEAQGQVEDRRMGVGYLIILLVDLMSSLWALNRVRV